LYFLMPLLLCPVLPVPMNQRWNLPVILCGVLAMTQNLPPSMAVLLIQEAGLRAPFPAGSVLSPRPSDGLCITLLPSFTGRDLFNIYFRPFTARSGYARQGSPAPRLGVVSGFAFHRYAASQAELHHYYGVICHSPPSLPIGLRLSTDRSL